MSGFFGGQQQSTPSAQYNFSSLPPQLQNLATTQANFLTSRTGVPEQPYPYAMAAPLSNQQQLGIGLGDVLAGQGVSTQGPAVNQINQTLSGAYLPQSDPYTQAIVQQMQQQQQQAQSQLQNTYGQLGLGNSQGLANALAQNQTQFGGQMGQLLLNQLNTGRNQQLAAIPYGLGAAQQGLQNIQAGGQLQQQTEQNQLTSAYNEYLRQAQSVWDAINQGRGLTSQAFQPTPVTNTYQPSIFSQLLQGASGLGGIFPNLYG